MGFKVSETWDSVTSKTKEVGEAAYEMTGDALETAANKTKEVGEAAYEKASDAVDVVVTTGKEVGQAAYEMASDAVDTVVTTGKEVGQAACEMASDAVDTIVTTGKEVGEAAYEMTSDAVDAVAIKTSEIGDIVHEGTKQLHEKYISNVIPSFGKYGDIAEFVAGAFPGIGEYQDILEGDWKGFATDLVFDTAIIGLSIVTGGTAGAVAGAARAEGICAKTVRMGLKGSEKTTEKIIAKKMVKEGGENIVEAGIKEVSRDSLKVVEKDALEASEKKAAQVVKNKLDGTAREIKVLNELEKKYGKENVIREALIRDSAGIPIKDLVDNTARKLDFVIIKNTLFGDKIIRAIEVTSKTASKEAQIAKQNRILEYAANHGGAYIKVGDKLVELRRKTKIELERLV